MIDSSDLLLTAVLTGWVGHRYSHNISVPLNETTSEQWWSWAEDICFYPGEAGWTVIFIVVNMSPQTSLNDVPVLRPLGGEGGGSGTLESLEKTVWWRVGHNSCGTKTPHEKSQSRLVWLSSGYFVLSRVIVLRTNLTSANSTAKEELVVLATALEKAVSELHRWLKDKTHSNSINKPEPGMRSGPKSEASMPKNVNHLLVDGLRAATKGRCEGVELSGFVDALLIQQDRHKLGSNTY